MTEFEIEGATLRFVCFHSCLSTAARLTLMFWR